MDVWMRGGPTMHTLRCDFQEKTHTVDHTDQNHCMLFPIHQSNSVKGSIITLPSAVAASHRPHQDTAEKLSVLLWTGGIVCYSCLKSHWCNLCQWQSVFQPRPFLLFTLIRWYAAACLNWQACFVFPCGGKISPHSNGFIIAYILAVRACCYPGISILLCDNESSKYKWF